ncbi:MAG TPA: polymer-forming cytoskeletal protein [Bacillota bacterium]|nr:polymer-forming cytoskeletal protein [Bacillota bacterium]
MAFDFNDEHVSISSDVAVTLIGANTRFKGSINTHTPIHIDGYFEGEIESDNIVEVSEQGSFKAVIKCRKLLLKGSGSGELRCSELMEFTETGVFTGDLHTADLIIVEGALMDGSCSMKAMRDAK